jgi:hypothetical protein
LLPVMTDEMVGLLPLSQITPSLPPKASVPPLMDEPEARMRPPALTPSPIVSVLVPRLMALPSVFNAKAATLPVAVAAAANATTLPGAFVSVVAL